jgi:hypothetical protein
VVAATPEYFYVLGFSPQKHGIDIRRIASPVATDLTTNTIAGGSLAGMRLASSHSNRRERFLLIIFVVSGL